MVNLRSFSASSVGAALSVCPNGSAISKLFQGSHALLIGAARVQAVVSGLDRSRAPAPSRPLSAPTPFQLHWLRAHLLLAATLEWSGVLSLRRRQFPERIRCIPKNQSDAAETPHPALPRQEISSVISSRPLRSNNSSQQQWDRISLVAPSP